MASNQALVDLLKAIAIRKGVRPLHRSRSPGCWRTSRGSCRPGMTTKLHRLEENSGRGGGEAVSRRSRRDPTRRGGHQGRGRALSRAAAGDDGPLRAAPRERQVMIGNIAGKELAEQRHRTRRRQGHPEAPAAPRHPGGSLRKNSSLRDRPARGGRRQRDPVPADGAGTVRYGLVRSEAATLRVGERAGPSSGACRAQRPDGLRL